MTTGATSKAPHLGRWVKFKWWIYSSWSHVREGDVFRLVGRVLWHSGKRHRFRVTWVDRMPFTFLRFICTRCAHHVHPDEYFSSMGVIYGCGTEPPRAEWLKERRP